MQIRTGVASIALATMATLVSQAPAMAQAAATAQYDIPAQELETSLNEVGRISGRQIIIATAVVGNRRVQALRGEFTADAAVEHLLAGSGIAVRYTENAILVGVDAATRDEAGPGKAMDGITVTGTRIRGAELISPRITVSRADIVNAGLGDVGAAMRAIPQNFGGGQNPGVGLGAASGSINHQNITGGSAVNLRGLGPDATLTLLNGHRLSFGGYAQGVDISAIPIEALERVEIVADGSSALYGSDAVAGVVNVILRKSFEGIATNTRLGTALDGGNFSQQYQVVAGDAWRSGNIMAAYGYRRNSRIEALDRSYTDHLGEPYPLLQGQNNHSAILSLTQDLPGAARLTLDVLFNRRHQSARVETYGVLQLSSTADKAITLAPSLEIPLGADWTAHFTGVYSRTKTFIHQTSLIDNVSVYDSAGCYCNSLRSAEAYLEGPVLALPGGQMRFVGGAGYRYNSFQTSGASSRSGGSQKDGYVYGEVFIPLVAEANAVAWVRSLSFTGAARLDRYNRFGSVATPKAGLVYSPFQGIDLKYSWGRSFKAPTLLQQYQPRLASLIPTAYFLGAPAVPEATGLYLTGGAPGLKPERATNMSWTIEIAPASIPGLDFAASYFRIRYKDRVTAPIGLYYDALNAAYAPYVISNPTMAAIDAAVAGASGGFNNITGAPYDPGQVAYIIDNYYTNVAVQRIKGLDLRLSYRQELTAGAILAGIEGSWLHSRQKNGSGFDYFDLAGTIWNPPSVRMRATAGWDGHRVKALAYLNYLGGVQDRRTLPYRDGASMVTVDLSFS